MHVSVQHGCCAEHWKAGPERRLIEMVKLVEIKEKVLGGEAIKATKMAKTTKAMKKQ